ncbi:MAG: hypothetical protein AAGL49_09560, partial [Pseudomonadota bacterium]
MPINLSMPETTELKPRITVVGVGGAGGARRRGGRRGCGRGRGCGGLRGRGVGHRGQHCRKRRRR